MLKKYHIYLDDYERRIVVNCLNQMRTQLLSEDKHSDPVDEILLKVIDAPIKKIKVFYKEG
ncbi:MAG: hypothetical protein PHV32_11920 [Eubacteriales bacterium]|nr:hypothetical protein [Eubacteriales bacterium]